MDFDRISDHIFEFCIKFIDYLIGIFGFITLVQLFILYNRSSPETIDLGPCFENYTSQDYQINLHASQKINF